MFDEDFRDECEFDWNIERHFGPGTEHVGNFDADEKEKLQKIINDSGVALFVDKAYVGNGETSDPSMVGVYGVLPEHIERFWAVYEDAKNDSHI